MTYKSGEVPQLGDSVMGHVDAGAAVRGVVVGLRDKGGILLQRRAEYEGPRHPLKLQHDEAASEDFELIYRHKPAKPEAAAEKPEKKARKK